ncbi:hypothetical protein BD560DRAFT_385695 [Blakeslea trispora]|nr:hypothetical protein BD560DRAFT_385695 [Blakeslea trispora]
MLSNYLNKSLPHHLAVLHLPQMFLICSSHCYICHTVSDPRLSPPPHFIDNCILMQGNADRVQHKSKAYD